MSLKFEVISHPAQRVLSIRTHAAMQDLPVVLPKSFDAVAQYICDLGQQPTGAPVVAYPANDRIDLAGLLVGLVDDERVFHRAHSLHRPLEHGVVTVARKGC